jgi:hypothetical protein
MLIEATRVYRIARSLAQNIIVMDFVEVSRARGESVWWILTNEILPNAFVPLSTNFGLRFTYSILLLSSLSFLGLGVQPPYADWGSMVKENPAAPELCRLLRPRHRAGAHPARALHLLGDAGEQPPRRLERRPEPVRHFRRTASVNALLTTQVEALTGFKDNAARFGRRRHLRDPRPGRRRRSCTRHRKTIPAG